MSKPEVFIIESLTFGNEEKKLFEGRIISDILALSRKQCKYFYVRTRRELSEVLKIFSESGYRYLHLSCHGGDDCLYTTLDSIPYREFGEMILPHIAKRRLFISACSAVNRDFGLKVMRGSQCFSILGPTQDIQFSDAAILWASLYHVMFRADSTSMKYSALRAKAQEVADMYRVRLGLIRPDDSAQGSCALEKISPRKEGL